MGFDIGNSYVLVVDLSLLRANLSDPLSPADMTLIDDSTGGILIPISKMMIAPIQNPFIGFRPDKDTPPLVFSDKYMF